MAFELVRQRVAKAEAERRRIRTAVEGASEDDLRPLPERADRYLDDVRLVGDAVVAAFFAGSNAGARERERAQVAEALELGGSGCQSRLANNVSALRHGAKPIEPFHFEIELP